MDKRYWLSVSGLPWQEATEKQYVAAENDPGFRSRAAVGYVTIEFSRGVIRGRTTYGKISNEKYPHDPEFVAQANAQRLTLRDKPIENSIFDGPPQF